MVYLLFKTPVQNKAKQSKINSYETYYGLALANTTARSFALFHCRQKYLLFECKNTLRQLGLFIK